MTKRSDLPTNSHLAGSVYGAVILSGVLLIGIQNVWAQPSGDVKADDIQVVGQKQVDQNIPGSYRYQSQYKMTKDTNGTYHSTYESQKTEWFCCMDWFSPKFANSEKAGES